MRIFDKLFVWAILCVIAFVVAFVLAVVALALIVVVEGIGGLYE